MTAPPVVVVVGADAGSPPPGIQGAADVVEQVVIREIGETGVQPFAQPVGRRKFEGLEHELVDLEPERA